MDRENGLFPYEEMMLLADLLFLKRVSREQVRKEKMVSLEHPTPTGDKERRARLEMIAEGEVLSATVKEVVQSMQAGLAPAALGSAATAAVT